MFILKYYVFFISGFVGFLVFYFGDKYVFIGIGSIWYYLILELYESIERQSKGVSDGNAKEFEKAVNLFYWTSFGFISFLLGGMLYLFEKLHSSFHDLTKLSSEGGEIGKGIFIIKILFAIIDGYINIVEFLYHKHFALFLGTLLITTFVVLWIANDNNSMEDEDETRLNKFEKLFKEKVRDLAAYYVATFILIVINLLYAIKTQGLISGDFFILLSIAIGLFLAAKVIYDQNRSNTEEWLEWFKRGEEYENRGEYKKALEAYSKVIELNPNFVGGYNNRGTLYYRLGEYENALEDFNKVIELNPNFGWVYYNRGLTYYRLGEYEKALENFNKAIELNLNYDEAYYYRGVIYYDLGKYRKALEDFNKVIELKPNSVWGYSYRGLIYYKWGKYRKALENFNKVIELSPYLEVAYNNRGLTYHRLGEYEKALEDFNKAIELNPYFNGAYLNRGNLHKDLGDYKKALEDYNKAIALDPNYAEAYYNRGLLHKNLGNTQKAISDFREACSLGLREACEELQKLTR